MSFGSSDVNLVFYLAPSGTHVKSTRSLDSSNHQMQVCLLETQRHLRLISHSPAEVFVPSNLAVNLPLVCQLVVEELPRLRLLSTNNAVN